MVETPMTQGMNQKARDALVAAIPVGRVGVPEDLWLAVKFCLECDYFNARTIDVDGGLSMWPLYFLSSHSSPTIDPANTARATTAASTSIANVAPRQLLRRS